MKFKALCMLAVTLGFGIGTSHAAPTPGQPAPAAGLERIKQEWGKKKRDIDADAALVNWRQIGVLKKGDKTCPEVDGWEKPVSLLDLALREVSQDIENCRERDAYVTHESLTGKAKRNLTDLARLHKLGLDRICVYTAKDPEKPDLSSLPSEIKPKPDRLALSTTSAGGRPTDMDVLSETIWPALADHFREQTLQSLDTAGNSTVPIPLPVEPSVRLTFIDSQPEGEGFPLALPAGSPHGYTLAYLARNVVCPDLEHCAALVTTRRALNFKDFSPKAVMPEDKIKSGSGHVGLVSDLATSIVAEVLHWRQLDPDKKLILNLSLGWDGELFGDLKPKKLSKLDPSVQAVYKAIQFARHSGALVIAAAGNRQGSSNKSTSPLLPAAWELHRPGGLPFFLGPRPVYAVGGVDWQGVPLSNSRRGGQPRRVAFADHAVAATEASDEPTAIYTGTSVSAASASSIAAVIWHLRPDLSPRQVIRLITRSGNRLPSQADFYGWKKVPLLSKIIKAPDARGLSLCRAIERACRQDGSRCLAPESLPECRWESAPPETAELVEGLDGLEGKAEPGSDTGDLPDVTSERWVTPQPEPTPCLGCTLLPEPSGGQTTLLRHTLTLALNQAWMTANPTVTLDTDARLYIPGLDPITLHGPFTLGTVYKFKGLAEGISLTGLSVYIDFTGQKPAEDPADPPIPVLIHNPVSLTTP